MCSLEVYIKFFGGQKGGSLEPPRTPPAYGPGAFNVAFRLFPIMLAPQSYRLFWELCPHISRIPINDSIDHTLWCHVMLCDVVWCHVMLCNAMTSCMSCHVIGISLFRISLLVSMNSHDFMTSKTLVPWYLIGTSHLSRNLLTSRYHMLPFLLQGINISHWVNTLQCMK